MTSRNWGFFLLRGFALAAIAVLAASSARAQWSVIAFHDDSDIGISSANSYTHAVDFFGVPNVNGVQFRLGGSGAFPGGQNNIPNALDAGGSLPGYVTGGARDLLSDFLYGNFNTVVRLDGLVVGQEYETRFYHRNWDAGAPFDRTQNVSVDFDGTPGADDTLSFNPDNPVAYVGGSDNVVPTILAYRFTAGAPSVQYSFDIANGNSASYHLYALTNEGPTVGSSRVKIPTLYNTGVDDAGVPLVDGAVDPHYFTTSSADGAYPGPDSFVINQAWPIAPAGPWLANTATSRWIAPRAEQDQTVNPAFGNQPGTYTTLTSFDLTGFVPETAQLEIQMWADNQVNDVILNGTPLGLTAPSFDPASGRYYVVNGPFVPGVNILEFVWTNLPPNLNPAGLRVELSGTAERVPEPSTYVLAGMGLFGLIAARRRRR